MMVRQPVGLLAYALPYRLPILGLFLAILISAAVAALQPWPIKWLVDILASGPNDPTLQSTVLGGIPREALLGLVCVLGLLLFAFHSALDVLLCWGWTVVGRRMVYALAAELFARLQRRSLLYHRRTAVGETVTRVNLDCWALYRLLDATLIKPVYAALSIGLMLFLMSTVDGFLTAIAALIAPAGVAASFFAGRRIRTLGEIQRTLESDLRSHVQQTLTGIPVVQSYGQESVQQDRFERIAFKLFRIRQQNILLEGLNGFASGVVLSVGAVIIIGVSAHGVIEGRITLGSVLLFAAYVGAIQTQLKNVVALYPMVQTLLASVTRVNEILLTPPELADRPSASALSKVEGRIRFENVCFGYGDDRAVLRNISFEAAAGQTIALVGPTGAGKSTLVSLIPRFFDPTSGRVLLDGRDLRDLRIASLRAQITIVLQEPLLLSGSVAENIAFGRAHVAQSAIEKAARAARAHDFIAAMPHGYETRLGEGGVNLSGGERQRISLARAFLKNAPILILDEPTNALDADTEALIIEAIQSLSRGRTTFIIAHRLRTMQNADEVLVLDQGAIIERGTPTQLAKTGNLYSRLHALNFNLTSLAS
jgi:ABC-type multidrug transport system fused ATPase/permease subunit